MEECALCQTAAKLCKSHIIPEFCYKPIYDEKHRLHVVDPVDARFRGYEQKGIRSDLLCEDCERLINDRYEKPFNACWYDNDAPAPFYEGERAQWLTGLDYTSFKLFHLSILFRASVSRHPNYCEVDLGPHLDRIRRMLIENDAGEEWQYPIVCSPIEGLDGSILDMVIGVARGLRMDDHWAYHFTFAGVQWIYVVSSHRATLVDDLRLTRDGRLPMVKYPWMELRHPVHQRRKS